MSSSSDLTSDGLCLSPGSPKEPLQTGAMHCPQIAGDGTEPSERLKRFSKASRLINGQAGMQILSGKGHPLLRNASRGWWLKAWASRQQTGAWIRAQDPTDCALLCQLVTPPWDDESNRAPGSQGSYEAQRKYHTQTWAQTVPQARDTFWLMFCLLSLLLSLFLIIIEADFLMALSKSSWVSRRDLQQKSLKVTLSS